MEPDCVAVGGEWMGLPNCEGVVCPPVATESTTWGRVKANYR